MGSSIFRISIEAATTSCAEKFSGLSRVQRVEMFRILKVAAEENKKRSMQDSDVPLAW